MLALAHSVERMIVAHKNRVRFPKSTKGELSELVYRTCLLNRQTCKKVSGVRVPHSPQKNMYRKYMYLKNVYRKYHLCIHIVLLKIKIMEGKADTLECRLVLKTRYRLYKLIGGRVFCLPQIK